MSCRPGPLVFAVAIGSLVLGMSHSGARSSHAQSSAPSSSGPRVRTLLPSTVGQVGGVAVDRLGYVYVADFRESVWKVTPEGTATVFATGLYGASGNAIDADGNLLQSSFHGGTVTRIDRHGHQEIVARGLAGPVGVAADPNGGFFVCNCRGNHIARVDADGTVSTFAEGDLFNCPNGITRAPDGRLFVVNYSDARMLEIQADGTARLFATIPGGGNGHVAVARGALYVTSFQGHRLYRVGFDGEVTHLAGTGALGELDGPAAEAAFSWPNGIAAGPLGDRLYVNDWLNRTPPNIEAPPEPRFTVRQIQLPSFADLVSAALAEGGIEAMEARYRAWKDDPATGGVYTEIMINVLAYQLMGSGNLEAAVRLFTLNTESYPSSANVWDSLAEAHMKAGRNAEAIRFYEKSLTLNPGNANATKMLETLRP